MHFVFDSLGVYISNIYPTFVVKQNDIVISFSIDADVILIRLTDVNFVRCTNDSLAHEPQKAQAQNGSIFQKLHQSSMESNASKKHRLLYRNLLVHVVSDPGLGSVKVQLHFDQTKFTTTFDQLIRFGNQRLRRS